MFILFSSSVIANENASPSLPNHNSDISGAKTLVVGVTWKNIKNMVKNGNKAEFRRFAEKHIVQMSEMYPEVETCLSAYFTHKEIEQMSESFKSEVVVRVCSRDSKKAEILFDFMKDIKYYSDQSAMQSTFVPDGEKNYLYLNILDSKDLSRFKSRRNNQTAIYIVVPYMSDYKDLKDIIFNTIYDIDGKAIDAAVGD